MKNSDKKTIPASQAPTTRTAAIENVKKPLPQKKQKKRIFKVSTFHH